MEESFSNFAHSLDGHEFFFNAPVSSSLSAGNFVTIVDNNKNPSKIYLGSIESVEITSERHSRTSSENFHSFNSSVNRSTNHSITLSEGISGKGKILGKIENNKYCENSYMDTFDHFFISRTSGNDVKLWLQKEIGMNNNLILGEIDNIEKSIEGYINYKNLNRHTFLTGQSGSGKSTVIKAIIRKLLETEDKPEIIVFDLNSEFKYYLSDLKDKLTFSSVLLAPESKCEEWESHLKIDFSTLNDEICLSLIDIDPIRNPETFFHFHKGCVNYRNSVVSDDEKKDLKKMIRHLHSGNYKLSKKSGYAFENISIYNWELWEKSTSSSFLLLNEAIIKNNNVVNIDFGSIQSETQKFLVADYVLDLIWKNRNIKKEYLIIIDEAHNLIPPNPSNLLLRNISQKLISITSEGRKYGLSLFICSQQPGKINQNILSLCNNLILLKTASRIDLDYIFSVFSSIPKDFINQAKYFKIGTFLVGGSFTNYPLFIKLDKKNTPTKEM